MSLRFSRIALSAWLVAAAPLAAQQSGWVMMLGADTVQVESATRTGRQISGLVATRTPTPRLLRYTIHLDNGGRMLRYEQGDARLARDSTDPLRSVMVFAGDSVFRDAMARGAPTSHRIAAPGGAYPFGTIPIGSSFQVLELALAHALRAAPGSSPTLARLSAGGFQATPSATRLLHFRADSVEVDYFGQGRFTVTFDAAGRLIRSNWMQTTYKVLVTRVPTIDVERTLDGWIASARGGQGMGALSPRDSVVATIGAAAVTITYSRPARRGRDIWGGIVPWNAVWRMGADLATHIETTADLVIGGTPLPAGRYTLWMLPAADGTAQLIISGLVNVFGTQYSPARDLARVPMERTLLPQLVERVTILVQDGRLQVAWGDAAYSVGVHSR